MPAPIAIFAYNRPHHFRRVMGALLRNREAQQSRVFVYSDAPRTDSAAQAVREVRDVARGVTGFPSVEIIEQRENLGIARSVIAGVTELTQTFGKVIVLEDDLLPSAGFLSYMNSALDLYEETPEVASVAGYFFPGNASLPETFFVRGADCWGWGTWARAWAEFEPSGEKLLERIRSRNIEREFDFDGSYPYTQMLCDQIEGRNDSWAIRWYASAFLRERLTLYPHSSQLQNIGADGSGVHVGATEAFHHANWGAPVRVERIPLSESAAGRRAFARGLRATRPSMARRVLRRLTRIASPLLWSHR